MQTDDAANGTTDSTAGVTRKRFEWARVRPTIAVVETVAARLGVDPLDLERLASAVDPDALDRLVTRRDPGAQGDVQTTFDYAGFVVTVQSSGLVSVAPTVGSDGTKPPGSD